MKIVLKSASDIGNIPVGYLWESKPMKASFVKTILFALATGDWNSVHVNPFTFFLFKSNLGGMTCPGDMVLSLTKQGIHDIFGFQEDTEILAFGYEHVEFKRPLRIGASFRYRYILCEYTILHGKAMCKWRIEVMDKKSKVISSAMWTNGYYPVTKSAIGKTIFPVAAFGEKVFIHSCVVLLALLPLTWFFYKPLNEWCYPIAP